MKLQQKGNQNEEAIDHRFRDNAWRYYDRAGLGANIQSAGDSRIGKEDNHSQKSYQKDHKTYEAGRQESADFFHEEERLRNSLPVFSP